MEAEFYRQRCDWGMPNCPVSLSESLTEGGSDGQAPDYYPVETGGEDKPSSARLTYHG